MLRLAITLFFLFSGATALVYQVIWVRMLGLVVGHSVFAVATVVATYMAGLGIGARVAGGMAPRIRAPLAAYGLMEVGIGVFALLSPVVLGLTRSVLGLGDGQVFMTLLASGTALLPPTLAMGATLPLITRWYARDPDTLGRDMGWLYAINTTGAFLGAGLAGFALLPWLGQPTSLAVAASVNIAIGLGAIALGVKVPLAPARQADSAQRDAPEPALPPAAVRAILFAFAVSGMAALINQVAWSRSFGLFTGSTTYAFSLIVCAFIAGMAVGGHVLARFVDRSADRLRLLAGLNVGIALSTALLIPIQGRLPLWLLEPIAALSGSFAGTQTFVFSVLFGLVLVPTVLMGGTYPVTTRALSTSPEDAPQVVGRAYAWNTAGAIAGSLLGGLVLIPLLELRGTLWLAVALNLVAAAVLLGRKQPLAWALPMVGLIGVVAAPQWNPRLMNLAPHMYAVDLTEDPEALRRMTESGSILFHEEGVGATVTVIQRETGARILRINGKTDASTHVDRLTQGVMGSLPLLLSEGRDDALVIGLGSGMTVAATLDAPLKHVDVVELLPEVVRGAKHFEPVTGDPLSDERVALHIGDGRHHVQQTQSKFDVVSSQPTNMFVSGISTLFTVEAFEDMRAALKPGGVALVWVQGYLLRDEDFRTVLRSFVEVFPEAHLWNAGAYDFCLTGHLGPLELHGGEIERRLAELSGSRTARWTGLQGVEDLQRHYLMGPDGLRALGEGLPLHRDRDPFLEFRAPRGLYGDDGLLDTKALLAARRPVPLTRPTALGRNLTAQRLLTTTEIDRVSMGDDAEALLTALRKDPKHPFGRLRLARVLHDRALARARSGDLDGAEADAHQVLLLEPLSLQTWRLMATARHVRGDQAGAVHALEHAAQLQPWNAYADLARSEYLASIGRADEARAARAKVIALDPDLPELF